MPQCYPARSDRHPPTRSHKLPQHDRPAGHPTDAQHLTTTGKPPATTAAQPRKMRLADQAAAGDADDVIDDTVAYGEHAVVEVHAAAGVVRDNLQMPADGGSLREG